MYIKAEQHPYVHDLNLLNITDVKWRMYIWTTCHCKHVFRIQLFFWLRQRPYWCILHFTDFNHHDKVYLPVSQNTKPYEWFGIANKFCAVLMSMSTKCTDYARWNNLYVHLKQMQWNLQNIAKMSLKKMVTVLVLRQPLTGVFNTSIYLTIMVNCPHKAPLGTSISSGSLWST